MGEFTDFMVESICQGSLPEEEIPISILNRVSPISDWSKIGISSILEEKIEKPELLDRPEKERMREVEKYMKDNEPRILDIGIGKVEKLTEDVLLEKTEDGFILYLVE